MLLLYHDFAPRSEIRLKKKQKGITINMAITFVPTTNIREVEVKGYGKVKVRPYGAGEELQISMNLRELNDLQTQAEAFLDDIRKKYDGDESQISAEEKAHFEEMREKVAKLTNDLNQLVRGTITSDKKGVADRLFAELPMNEIRRLINTALERKADAKA